MSKEMSVFPTGEKNVAYAQYFIGQSYLIETIMTVHRKRKTGNRTEGKRFSSGAFETEVREWAASVVK